MVARVIIHRPSPPPASHTWAQVQQRAGHPESLSKEVLNEWKTFYKGETCSKWATPKFFAVGLLENLSRCGFIWMLISCKPADLYLQDPPLFWKISKCPLNWAGSQHNLPILFVTTRLMAGLALNLLVTSFTWGCLFNADNNDGLVVTAAILLLF